MKKYLLCGFVAGVAVSVLYLRFGEWEWWYPKPEWAQILFLPGLLTGHFLYDTWLNEMYHFDWAVRICQVAGVLTEGFVFAGLAFLVRLVLRLRS